jgi:hypothetical protein
MTIGPTTPDLLAPHLLSSASVAVIVNNSRFVRMALEYASYAIARRAGRRDVPPTLVALGARFVTEWVAGGAGLRAAVQLAPANLLYPGRRHSGLHAIALTWEPAADGGRGGMVAYDPCPAFGRLESLPDSLLREPHRFPRRAFLFHAGAWT